MLPAYALGALEPDEMLAVDAYLDQHPELTERLAEIEEALLPLADLTPPAPLPGGGKARLMARVRADMAESATAKSQPEQTPAGGDSWVGQVMGQPEW